MKLITSSCSFNGHLVLLRPFFVSQPNMTWRDWPRIWSHVGEPGRSNKWIGQSIMWKIDQVLNEDPDENIIAIANWSSVDRTELIVDKDSNKYHNEISFYDYTDPKYFTKDNSYRVFKWFDEGNWTTDNKWEFPNDNKRNGLLSITNIRPDLHSEYAIENFSALYRKYFYNKIQQFEQTLISIVMLQHYCEQRGVLLLNCSWQDIWHDTSIDTFEVPLSLAGQTRYLGKDHNMNQVLDTYEHLPLRIEQYPQFQYLYDQINFDNWYFNKTDRCKTGGVADWCVENNIEEYFYDCHPTDAGWKAFCKQEFIPWVSHKTKMPIAEDIKWY